MWSYNTIQNTKQKNTELTTQRCQYRAKTTIAHKKQLGIKTGTASDKYFQLISVQNLLRDERGHFKVRLQVIPKPRVEII